VDDPQSALSVLTEGLVKDLQVHSPAFARSRTSQNSTTWHYQRSGD
jgi:hypothetical protein